MLTENSSPNSQPLPMIKLWTPRALSLITFFIGFPSGITLASINWVRMGMKGKAFAHILGGIAGILLLLTLPENVGGLFGIVVNIGYITYLRQQMKGDIEKIRNFSIQNAHWLRGLLISLIGWGIVVAIVLSVSFLRILIPGNSLYYSNRGDNYFKKGDYDHAIAEYTKAIELDPGLSSLYYNRGLTFSYNGDYDSAISDFSQVIKLKPNDEGAYFERGYNFAMKGDYEPAIADYTRVLQLNSGNAYAYNNRGLAYEDLGRNDEAIKDFEQVLELSTEPNLRKGVEEELQKLKGK